MTAIKVSIHSVGPGTCVLTGKEDSDGLTVTFEDGTTNQSFLSWKAFRQLLAMKATQTKATGSPLCGTPATKNGDK